MENIEIKTALKYTKELRVLYAEDDVDLRTSTHTIFESLFGYVCSLGDGASAFEEYKKENYDLLITDVQMPKMDGVSLSQGIKEINASQAIIITSAHNDSESLQKFINLNVNNFILKPMNTNDLINTIYEVSKNIVNAKMVEVYRKDLERTNGELKEKNDELQSLVRILDSKVAQISTGQSSLSKEVHFDEIQISLDDLEELKELETDISGASVLISLSNNINVSNIQVLGTMFGSYSQIITKYPEYIELKEKVENLASSLNTAPENFIKRVEDISVLLESFIYVLRMWRKNLVEGEMKKAFELHASMTNDISTIISIIDGTENDIESEMEFF